MANDQEFECSKGHSYDWNVSIWRIAQKGHTKVSGGRVGESATRLATNLLNLGLRLGRLKTGTCPRLEFQVSIS